MTALLIFVKPAVDKRNNKDLLSLYIYLNLVSPSPPVNRRRARLTFLKNSGNKK